jgi:hypothetical protein
MICSACASTAHGDAAGNLPAVCGIAAVGCAWQGTTASYWVMRISTLLHAACNGGQQQHRAGQQLHGDCCTPAAALHRKTVAFMVCTNCCSSASVRVQWPTPRQPATHLWRSHSKPDWCAGCLCYSPLSCKDTSIDSCSCMLIYSHTPCCLLLVLHDNSPAALLCALRASPATYCWPATATVLLSCFLASTPLIAVCCRPLLLAACH